MTHHEVYIAVVATVEDGVVTGFHIDLEGPVGSSDGHVWNVEEERYERDEPPMDQNPYRLLTEALKDLV